MTYKEARQYIEECSSYGMVLGLDTMQELLLRLNNPERELTFLHVAGTNGKGSVAAFLSTVLLKAGYCVGRYTSPAVFKYRECIQVNGRYIEKDPYCELTEQIKAANGEMIEEGYPHPTSFEIETALAFLYFKRKQCDFVVLETGLGGRLDATNCIPNKLCAVFTSIGKDHMGILGNSLKEIALEKAGIIKNGCNVVTAAQDPEVMDVLIKACGEQKSGLNIAQPELVSDVEFSTERQKFTYKEFKNIEIGLLGSYQLINAALALEVILTLQKAGVEISNHAVFEGMKAARWNGRFSVVNKNPLFFIDGAHNEAAAIRLRESLELYILGKRIIYIIGIFSDKEYNKILSHTLPLAGEIITITIPENERAMSALELAKAAKKFHPRVTAADSLQEAVEMAFLLAGEDDAIVAFGSLSYLGKLTEIVQDKEKMRSDLHGK